VQRVAAGRRASWTAFALCPPRAASHN
jgi:hypothetical protein